MDISNLQDIWSQYDKDLAKKKNINKEKLKMMMAMKSGEKINRMRHKAWRDLTIPVACLAIAFSSIKFRHTTEFYVGLFMFIAFSAITYYLSIKYYLSWKNLDSTSSVANIRKSLKKLKKYKLQTILIASALAPFGVSGIFIVIDFPILSHPYLIVFILIMSIIGTYMQNRSIFKGINEINNYLREIEDMESE